MRASATGRRRGSLTLCWIFILLPVSLSLTARSLFAGHASKPADTLPLRAQAQAIYGTGSSLGWQKNEASASGILVRLRQKGHQPSSVAALLQSKRLKVARTYASVPGLQRIEKADSKANRSFEREELLALIAELKASGLYAYVEPDWTVSVLQVPTDAALADGTLWGLQNTGQFGGTAGVDVNVIDAWSLTTGDSDVIVGVVDTGVRYTHQDLAGNMWVNPGETPGDGIDNDGNGYVDDVYGINAITGTGDPMDDNNHGTHVAGTIAATANDSGGHVGVAYGTRIMALKFIAAAGTGDTSDAIACIDYAIEQGVDILNNSWGGGGYSQALADAITAANDAGILFVAAAGNSALDNDSIPHYPSNYDLPNVVAVAAIDRNGNLANFSNYGSGSVDLGAPGVAIYSATAASDLSYASYDGTSMASPHVAGVAALLKSQHPGASTTELKNRLLITTSPLASLSGQVATGGMVDAHAGLVIAEDGVLELQAASAGPLREGVASDFYITVTDVNPVFDAVVTGNLDGGASSAFSDDGIGPDSIASDGVYSASLMVPVGTSSVDLNVNVTASGKNPASQSFTFPVLTPPPNDDFADRIALEPGTILSNGSNVAASTESGESLPSAGGGRTVWWEWTAPSTGEATITTEGSDFDTVLAVYAGETLGGLSLVGTNDDLSLYVLQSSVTFQATADLKYQIQVDGYAGDEGAIQLNYPGPGGAEGPPVIITQPSAQTVIIGDSFDLSVSAVGSAPLSYQWNLNDSPISGANSASYSVASATESDQGHYTVLVTNTEGSDLSAPAFVTVNPVGVLPVNDHFGGALVLTAVEGQLSQSTVRTTGESGEPDHAGVSNPLASLWYRWTAPSNGTLEVVTINSDFDTTLAAYTGTTVDALTEITSNDDFLTISQSYIDFPVLAGETYHIAVDGYGSAEGQVLLTYSFTVAPPPPVNDDFEAAIDLGTGSASTTGTSVGATGQTDEPNHAGGSIPLSSVWWQWMPPVTGSVTISTVGSDFDTTLAAYTGTSVAGLSLVASNDDIDSFFNTQSEISFSVSSGTVYRIAVDGYDVTEGSIALTISYSPDSVPEIAIESGATSLIDGLSSISFGPTAINASSTRSLTVRNLGTVPLEGISLSISGGQSGDFLASSLPASLLPGGSADFDLVLTPSAAGVRSATMQVFSSDSDESPFDLALSGQAETAINLYLEAATTAGLSGGEAEPQATPQGDGVANLLKYAFNMDLAASDSTLLSPNGLSGLPRQELTTDESSNAIWSFEYLRRKGSGLIYQPMHSDDLDLANFTPMTGPETVTQIDNTWERVRIDQDIDTDIKPNGFGYLEILLTD